MPQHATLSAPKSTDAPVRARTAAPPPRAHEPAAWALRAPGAGDVRPPIPSSLAGLRVSAPGDRDEREADRASDAVMRGAPPRIGADGGAGEALRRKEAGRGASPASPPAGRAGMGTPGRPLEPATRAFFEMRFGRGFGGVRVHTGGEADASARAVDARAYTVGRDLVFAAGQYRPGEAGGMRLLAHELAHVAQQEASGAVLVQRAPPEGAPTTAPATPPPTTAPATPPASTAPTPRERVERQIINFSVQAILYEKSVPVDFEASIQSLYLNLTVTETILRTQLAGDATLTAELRAAYISAVRALVTAAAASLGKSEDELYRANTGRIPPWAWSKPHHQLATISTPVPEGVTADAAGEASFRVNGVKVILLPDKEDPTLTTPAETKHLFGWTTYGYSRRKEGGKTYVDRITKKGTLFVRLQTLYRPGSSATSQSGYGRGTTPEDKSGGKTTPHSTSLGFHEGMHGIDFLRYLETHTPPRFGGREGMLESTFKTAEGAWQKAWTDFGEQAHKESVALTDCVGAVTIDQYNQANAPAGTTITKQCP